MRAYDPEWLTVFNRNRHDPGDQDDNWPRVGMSGMWWGERLIPRDATWNPPPPGWKLAPPWPKHMCTNVEGVVTRVEVVDGKRIVREFTTIHGAFDPSVHPSLLKPL